MEWSEEDRLISSLRQTQKERPTKGKTKQYAKRTKKIWDDRIKAQEKNVELHRRWLKESLDRKEKMGPAWTRGWGDPAMYQSWLDCALNHLAKVKAQAGKALS